MFGADDSFGRASAAALRAEGLAMERLTPDDAQRRYPQIRFDGVSHVYVEPEAGYLLARRACEHVAERVVAEGGEYRQTAIASPVRVAGGRLSGLPAGGDRPLDADAYVFACGPWLGTLFPEEIGTRVQPTRQSVLYFGTSPGDLRFQEDRLPVWVDYGERLIYGIPGNVHRGFKLADDTAGPPFDPTGGDRSLASGEVEAARAFLKRRFPALGGAPFLGSEVCQYESSPDANFIVDRHPAASNVWIVGGGSGHGYKMGPAIGEMMASLVLGLSQPDPFFSLARFTRPPARAAGSDLRSLWTQG
jgi:glycine/D-amino acid oxidase-like deaminating enzyme